MEWALEWAVRDGAESARTGRTRDRPFLPGARSGCGHLRVVAGAPRCRRISALSPDLRVGKGTRRLGRTRRQPFRFASRAGSPPCGTFRGFPQRAGRGAGGARSTPPRRFAPPPLGGGRARRGAGGGGRGAGRPQAAAHHGRGADGAEGLGPGPAEMPEFPHLVFFFVWNTPPLVFCQFFLVAMEGPI